MKIELSENHAKLSIGLPVMPPRVAGVSGGNWSEERIQPVSSAANKNQRTTHPPVLNPSEAHPDLMPERVFLANLSLRGDVERKNWLKAEGLLFSDSKEGLVVWKRADNQSYGGFVET